MSKFRLVMKVRAFRLGGMQKNAPENDVIHKYLQYNDIYWRVMGHGRIHVLVSYDQ